VSREGIPYLMYHEIEAPDRRLNQSVEGYVRYVVSESAFREQMKLIADSGFVGHNVTGALGAKEPEKVVAITFDDGCETDLLVAAPILKEHSFGATFYIVAGLVGQPGYLSVSQLRALHEAGFEIGSHSMTHSYLKSLNSAQLRSEIFDSKDRLEQLIGNRVDHFSCPGGRWESRVSELAKEAGYRSVATSEIGLNSATTDPYRLTRIAVFRSTSESSFAAICRREGLAMRRLKSAVLDKAKDVLGDSTYDRIRAGIFSGNRGKQGARV
jgi:peptidoglycan/xylan/chitin deacetylase (PgdA/CDA1 family)